MPRPFPHHIVLSLIASREAKDLGKIYGVICEAITSDDRELFVELFRIPELSDLPALMLEHYLALQEYETCAKISKLMDEISH